MNRAPVILFVYNRPEHTKKVLGALEENELSSQTEVFIFSDGPKENAASDTIEKISRVRQLIREKYNFKSTIVVESKINKGLSRSVIDGVNQILSEYESVIVLEDDHITSPYFLSYMNDALEIYKNNSDVACVSGYIYPVKGKLPETFFLKGADCWGWQPGKGHGLVWKRMERNYWRILKMKICRDLLILMAHILIPKC